MYRSKRNENFKVKLRRNKVKIIKVRDRKGSAKRNLVKKKQKEKNQGVQVKLNRNKDLNILGQKRDKKEKRKEISFTLITQQNWTLIKIYRKI